MDGEDMLHCPYNYSHVILKSRMASHLHKCREQFPLEKYTTCPFNATHDVPAPELKYHADTCPDRKTMESYLYVMDDEKEEEEALNPGDVQALSLEENWDDDKVSGSYLEAKNKIKMEQKIFKVLVGKSKSEKKAFSQSQVQKFQKDVKEKSNKGKPESGPSKFAPEVVYKHEWKLSEPEPEMGKSSHEEEEFMEVERKSKKSGRGRGSILRGTYSED